MDLERYRRQLGGMELIQQNIEVGTDSMKLAWTPRVLLPATAMEAILADLVKRMASVNITVMSAENKNKSFKKAYGSAESTTE